MENQKEQKDFNRQNAGPQQGDQSQKNFGSNQGDRPVSSPGQGQVNQNDINKQKGSNQGGGGSSRQ